MAVSCKLNSVLVSFFHLFKSHAVLFSFGIQRKRHFLQKLLPMDLDRRLQFSDIILKCKTTIPTSLKKKTYSVGSTYQHQAHLMNLN